MSIATASSCSDSSLDSGRPGGRAPAGRGGRSMVVTVQSFPRDWIDHNNRTTSSCPHGSPWDPRTAFRITQAEAAGSTCARRVAPPSSTQPSVRANSTIPSHWSAQSAAVALGSAAARSAATSSQAVPSSSRPSSADRSAWSASSSVTAPTATCSRVRSSTSATCTCGTSSAPPITSTITARTSFYPALASSRLDPEGGHGAGDVRAGARWSSYVPREPAEVGVPLRQERVPALDRLLGHVGQPGRLPGKQLLTDQSVVDQVERVLQHPLGGRALGDDPPSPLQRG